MCGSCSAGFPLQRGGQRTGGGQEPGAGRGERGGRAEGGTDRGREEGETRRERERQAGDPGEEEARNGAGRDVLTGYLVPGSVGQGGV